MTSVIASRSFPALGTTAVVQVAEPAALDGAEAAVRRVIDAIDLACSRFRDDSELSALNAGAGAPTAVSPLLAEAIEVAVRAARLTAGRVDPTVGVALLQLGYDRDFALVEPAGPPLTVTALPVPGWQAIRIDHDRGTVSLPAGVSLDLGATAKALCADLAARAALEAAGSGVLVSLGGDLSIAGPPPGQGWRIRVTDDHAAPVDAPGQTIELASGGLATSSTTVRRWARGGQPCHHLVDPHTGRPAPEWWRTVTVAAGTCVDANIASTASIILGPKAPAWLAARALPARLVGRDGQVELVAGWPSDGEGAER